MRHSLLLGSLALCTLPACASKPDSQDSSTASENQPPDVAVSLSPANPDGGATITAVTAQSDPEGDEVLIYYPPRPSRRTRILRGHELLDRRVACRGERGCELIAARCQEVAV